MTYLSQDVKSVYKRCLLLDIEYKKLKMRKLEKEVSKNVNTAQVDVFGIYIYFFFSQLRENE